MPSQENLPAYIPRPPNPFICFRSRFIRDQKAKSEPIDKMQDMSRRAAHLWNEMSEQERRPFVEMADRMKEEHLAAHPDYKFSPGKRAADKRAARLNPVPVSRPSRRPQASASQQRQEPEPVFAFDGGSPGPTPTLSHDQNSRSEHGVLRTRSTHLESRTPPAAAPTSELFDQDTYAEQQPDFDSFCQWDHDFSRAHPARSQKSHYRPY